MPTKTLTSYMVVSYQDLSGIMEEGWDELIDCVPEFQKAVTYRHIDLDTDNMTGDIDRSSYTDYVIYAEVQIIDINDRITKTGELQSGDAEIFLPAKVLLNTSGDIITEPFRPQIDDEILWKGIRYRIQRITFERIGAIEIFADCLCKRIGNVNPDLAWNDNYEVSDGEEPGRGWS